MNIFVLHNNPQQAAQMHCDKHVVKMILESAQMLCTVSYSTFMRNTFEVDHGGNISDSENKIGYEILANAIPYKSTHVNHPCTIWAGKSKQNYKWLLRLMVALHNEWRYRYNHTTIHKSMYKLMYGVDYNKVMELLPDEGLTPFAQAMPDVYRNDDAVEAYRAYYIGDKANLLNYTKRNKPEWLGQ